MNWTHFAAGPWETAPLMVSGGSPPVDVDLAYQTVVAAAAPFRDGSRFRALPEVRFNTARGRIGAPGELLPGAGDEVLKQYLHRRADEPFLLTVREPLLISYPLWSEVRALVEPLWHRIGLPVVPVGSELGITDRLTDDRPDDRSYAVLAWVLSGRLRAELPGGEVLEAAAGDLLSWPGGRVRTDGEECLYLRLRVPTDGGLAAKHVAQLLTEQLQRRRDSDETPYLSLPPERESDGTLSAVAPLASTAAGIAELSTSSAIERSLRIQWSRRASAGALEPVPPPRPSDLAPGQRVRAAARILRMPERDGGWIWAVNGHAFPVSGNAADGLLDRLRHGAVDVHDDAFLPLLRRLHALRAVDLEGA